MVASLQSPEQQIVPVVQSDWFMQASPVRGCVAGIVLTGGAAAGIAGASGDGDETPRIPPGVVTGVIGAAAGP